MPQLTLADLVDDKEAECYAALVSREIKTKKNGELYYRCQFRDRALALEAMIWPESPVAAEAPQWPIGAIYWLKAKTKTDQYGRKLEILAIRPVNQADYDHGLDDSQFYEASSFPRQTLRAKLDELIDKNLTDPHLKRLVEIILNEHGELLDKMPAAQKMHHAYTRGLLEHVWSMTRVAVLLGKHYAQYYKELDPPLNVSLVITTAIVHDLGKIYELEYLPTGASYTRIGKLIGHVIIGRDMVRDAAGRIEGFPQELLLQLEHAVLAHHGKREFGAPVLPQTLEAILISFIDDMDAKMNAAAQALMTPGGEGGFTEKVYALDQRTLYRGVRRAAADNAQQATAGREESTLPQGQAGSGLTGIGGIRAGGRLESC